MTTFRKHPAHLLTLVCLSLAPFLAHGAFTTGNLAVFSADSASANNTTFTILELSPAAAQGTPVNAISINGTTGPNALRTSGSASSTGYLADSDDGKLLVFSGHNTTTTSGNINTVLSRGVGTLDNAGTFGLQTTYTGVSGNQTRGASSVDSSTWFVGDQGGIYSNGGTATLRSGNFRSVKSFGGNLYVLVASASYPPVLALATSPVATNGLPGLPNGDSSLQDFYLLASGNSGATYDVLYILSASSATVGTVYKYSLVNGFWTANGTYSTTFGGFGLCAAKSGSGAVLYVTTGTGATAANSVLKLTDTAGYNAPIAITTANTITLYTAAAGTTLKGIAFAPACKAPTATVRGTDSTSLCSGGAAVIHADLTGTAPWTVSWSDGVIQSNLAASPATRTVAPAATTAYMVTSISDATACAAGTAAGTVIITVNPIPSAAITTAGTVCPNSTNNTALVPDAGPGAAYGWTITGGSISSLQANTITFAAGASGMVLLGCTVTNSAGCYSSPGTAGIAISDAVLTMAGNGGPYCAGATVSLTASGSAGDIYGWTGPNGFTSSAQNPTIANASTANAGDYTVTRTTACGSSAPSKTTVVVNPVPKAIISAAAAVCGNSAGNTASVPDAGPGASYSWTLSGGSITTGAGTTTITYTANASGTVLLGCTVVNGAGCSSNASTVSVTINPLPDPTIAVSSATYVGSTNNPASVPDAGVGASYAWTITGGNVLSGQGTRSIVFQAGAPGTLTLGCTVTAATGCCAVGSARVTVHPPFTTHNLAVVRIGDGAATLSSAATPVFVDEFSPAGVLVQSLALPTNGSSAFVNSGSASSEGALTRSPDGRLICLAGYNANVGLASIASSASASVPRVVATLDAGGSFTLAASTSTQFSGNNVRSAATDGTNNFWGAGGSSGTYYFGTASTSATVQNTLANTRVLNICNGSLYFTAGSGGGLGLYSFGGLPVTAAAATTSIATGTGSSPYAFALSPDGTVVYIADDRAIASGGGIQKWTYDGSAWSLAYTLGTGPGSTTGARGLVVDFSGSNAVLYATTTESGANRLVVVTDAGSTSVAATLATAAANTVFRGVAFAPEAAPALVAQPQAVSTCSGSTATFTAAADGVAPLFAQWQVSADAGAHFSDIPGATSGSYNALATEAVNGQQFRVIYSNNYGAVTSAVVALTVSAATATNFTWDAYAGGPFRLAESALLAHAAGSGGVTLASVDASSLKGVSLIRSNGVVFYSGSVAGADSFHYTVASVTGGCTATALVSVAAVMNISSSNVTLSNNLPLLSFTVLPNYSYTVQRSTNLANWQDVLTTNAPGPFNYLDPTAPQPAAFYRLRYNP